MASLPAAIQELIFRRIAPELQGAIMEVSQKKLFNEFQVAVRTAPLEMGNTVFQLEEAPQFKRVVGQLKQSSNVAKQVAGYALELKLRKDGKRFKLTNEQRQEIIAVLKRRLRAT